MAHQAILMLVVLLITACTAQPVPSTAMPTATPTHRPTATPAATRTSTPVPTATPTAPPTLTPSPTPLPTCTPVPEEIIYVIDGTVYRDLEPGIELGVWEATEVLQQALERRAPAWAQYRVETVQNPVHPLQGSLADYIWNQAHAPLTLVNPRVLLVTAGVALDWQIPQDRPLPDAISEIGGRLREHYLAFRFDPKVRAQHPEVANAASYALYAFFGYDRGKVRLWEQTYQELFGPHTLRVAAMPTPNATPRPFMARPFRQPPVPTPFYTLNSFLDHDAPYAYDEGTLTRFDGQVLPGDRNECDLGKSCYSGHEGLDYDTGRDYPDIRPPVYAVADGRVSVVKPECGQVEILHEARQVVSVYMHMEDIQVTRNQTVTQGTLLGYTGNVATNRPGECSSSGAHLHFHVRFQHHTKAFIEPFGWWGTSSDPLETYMADGWSGSWWLWQGDEAGDGSLVVDDRESQAQLFHPVHDRESGQTWWHDPGGYNGGAWWTYEVNSEEESTNWGIWGTYIATPGPYVVQAYIPDNGDALATFNARYRIYAQNHTPQPLVDEVWVDQEEHGGGWYTLGTYDFPAGVSVVILTDFTFEGPQRRLPHPQVAATGTPRVYFDAVRWVTPTPSATPTPTPTRTPTPTPSLTPTFTPRPTDTPIPTSTTPTPAWRPLEFLVLAHEPMEEQVTTSRLLSRVRDEIMAPGGPKGRAYITLVYRHVDEITTILARDATLRSQARALLLDLRPLLADLVTHREQSQMRLTAQQAARLQALLGGVTTQASPALRADLAWWQAHLSDFVGMTAWEIWQALPAVPGANHTLYLPLVVRNTP